MCVREQVTNTPQELQSDDAANVILPNHQCREKIPLMFTERVLLH